MKKFMTLSLLYSILIIFTKSQEATNTNTNLANLDEKICEISKFGEECHKNKIYSVSVVVKARVTVFLQCLARFFGNKHERGAGQRDKH